MTKETSDSLQPLMATAFQTALSVYFKTPDGGVRQVTAEDCHEAAAEIGRLRMENARLSRVWGLF